jgi:hypothetical protein
VGHADRVGRFKLPFVDRVYASAHDFSHVRACVYRHDESPREQQVHAYAEPFREPVKNYYCLNNHGRSAENLDICRQQRVYRLKENTLGDRIRLLDRHCFHNPDKQSDNRA